MTIGILPIAPNVDAHNWQTVARINELWPALLSTCPPGVGVETTAAKRAATRAHEARDFALFARSAFAQAMT